MKTIENITLYKCDFCKKELKRKHSMESHEQKCSNNPVNDRPCLHCPNLERRDIEIDTGISTYHGEPITRKASAFFCASKNILILHPKTQHFERLENIYLVKFNGKETEQVPMPTQCDIYDSNSHLPFYQ